MRMNRFDSTKTHAVVVVHGVAARDRVCAPPGVTDESLHVVGG
jgi:hypothetical protein